MNSIARFIVRILMRFGELIEEDVDKALAVIAGFVPAPDAESLYLSAHDNALLCVFDFFFQAEDGIRDGRVTGVQTCALPISPWQVERVELKLSQGEVHVYLAHQNQPEWACAECGALGPLYDHQPEREWRHLDTCQYRTILHAAPPRLQCPEHGVRVVKLSWAEPGSRFTALFEALAITWLKHASQKAVAEQLQLSWDEVHAIMERAVKRGLARRHAEEIPQLGIDEKAFRKGHKYLTLVNDLKRNRVLYVAEDREQSSLDGFWSTITAEQRASIEAVALDMWDPYLASLRDHLPEAEKKIVFDKFHIAKHLGEAVDRVRRREHKALKAEGDERLTGTKYDWLRNPTSMDGKQIGRAHV